MDCAGWGIDDSWDNSRALKHMRIRRGAPWQAFELRKPSSFRRYRKFEPVCEIAIAWHVLHKAESSATNLHRLHICAYCKLNG